MTTVAELKKELDKYPDDIKVEVLILNGGHIFFGHPDLYYDKTENKLIIDAND